MEEQRYDGEETTTSTTDMQDCCEEGRSISPSRSPTRRRIRPSTIQKGSDVEQALIWLYSRDNSIKDAKYLQKLNAKIPLDVHNSYEERAKDLVDTLTWMRQRRRERNQITMNSSCNTTMTI